MRGHPRPLPTPPIATAHVACASGRGDTRIGMAQDVLIEHNEALAIMSPIMVFIHDREHLVVRPYQLIYFIANANRKIIQI